VTFGCRKTNGKWKIAHEHFSAPFDPVSGKALFDLQP
jgi:ketosteroid isomerase-like protein